MLKEVGYRYKEVLNETQESESIKAAKKLYMQRRGGDGTEIDRWVRIDLRGDDDDYPEDICLKNYGDESFLTRLRKKFKNEGKTIIISEKQAQILKEHILNEGISNIVYHFTSIDSLYGIVINNKFYLKSGIFGSGSDLGGGKRMFYLSTTRNRNAKEGYSFMGKTSVRITLDGEKLAQKYHGQPFNYWGDGSLGRMSTYSNPPSF